MFKVRVILTIVTDMQRGDDEDFDEYIRFMIKPSRIKNTHISGLINASDSNFF